MNKVLGMEMLPIKQQRFTRKRRREGSTGEGNETEDGITLFYYLNIVLKNKLLFLFFEVGENNKKDKREDDSVSQNLTNDSIDADISTTDEISNGEVAIVKTEKIDTE